MPIKKEKLDSIKGYREYQKRSGAAAAVSSPAPASYAPAQKPARVKQDKREQIYTYYRPVSTPKMTEQEKKATSPMFRQQPTVQQNVVAPKNQNALAQGLGKGALQQQEAKNYQSEKAFNQHVQDVKPKTTMQRVGNTLKGAAKTYGAGFVNLSGVAAQGQGGTAMSPVYRSQAETLDQQIAALEATLSDPTMTAQDIADTKEAIAIARSEREKYGKIIESEEKTVEGAYDIADRLADSGTRDINKAKSGLGKVGQLAVDVGVAGAQMGADAVLGLATGGSALFPMFMRSAGGSAQEARRAGATHEQQVNYGLASGALSVATEKIANVAAPFKKMFGGGFLDNAIDGALARMNGSAAGKIALSFLSEGGEEVIEDLLQPALQTIYNGKSLGGSYSEMEASEIINDFLVGGILGGLGGGVEVAANRFARFDNSLGESGRKAIRGSYQEGKDTAEHVKDFIPAYNAGVEGKANPNPTNETAYAGYVAGQNDAKAEARKKTFAQESDGGSGLVYDDYVSREMDSATADEINTVAKALGVRVRMADAVRGGTANGVIEGNEIRIAKDAQDPVMQVVGHEWTHRVQELAPEQYTAFRDAIMEDPDVAEAANILHEQYNRMGVEISVDEALDEAAANYAGEMIANTDVLNEFIRRHSEDRTLLEKLRDAIREIVGKLTGKAKQQAQTAEGLLQQAFEAAAQNSKNAATEGGVRFDLKGKNKDGVEVYETGEDVKKMSYKERMEAFMDIMRNEYAGRTAKFSDGINTYYAKFDEADLRKNVYGDKKSSQKGWKAKINTGADGSIFELVENATYNGGKAEQGKKTQAHQNLTGWEYFVKTVQIDGQVYDLLANVRKKPDGEFVYSIQLNENKASAPPLQYQNGTAKANNRPVGVSTNASNGSVPQNGGNVNKVNDAQFSREIPEANYEALKEKYGYIPAGERAYREVQVPKKTADDKYVSRTIRTVLEAKATPDAMVPTLERMVAKGDFSYDRYTDKQAISDAESRIKTEGWQKTLNKWKSSTKEGISKENTAIGWALYNNAANSGDVETAIDVLDTIVKRQRNAAQALQATRLLKQQDPSTQLYAAQRSVENLTEDLKKQYGEKAPDLKIDRDLAEKFLNAKDDDARTEAMKEIYRDIGRQMPSRFIDKWNAWRYLSMLGNPRTHVRNIVGNVGFVPAVTVKNVIGAGIESAANAVSGGKVGRTKAILTTKDAGLIKAAWSDYANIREQALGSGKYNDNVNVRQEIEEGRTVFKLKPLEAMRKFNSTALDAEDAWFSKPHYAAALAQFCKANGITAEQVSGGKGIEAAREYAIREAQKATYRDTNAFSQMISDLGRYRGDNKMKRLGSTLAEGILPFRKTPANILVRGVEYSPIGFLKSISYDLVQVQKGNMQATEMIDRAAAGLTGTGLMMLGLYMAKEGILRGSGGDDEKKKKFDELQGHQEYAMELPNGTSITLDWLAPEALPFFVGANLYEQMQANNGYLTMSDMLQAASNVTDPLLSMSCLQSLNDVFDAVGYASSGDTNALTSAVASAATSYLTQGIPTVFGQAERTGESTRMTTYTDKNKFLTPDMQYALGKASARIPGVDYGQIPFIDAWGRTENSGGVAARAFNNFANPAYTSKVSGSKMEDELSRLYEATGETKVLPQRAPKFFTVNKENKQLTGEEYVKYATKRGQTSYKIVSELTGLASYKSMSDGDKADAVAKAYEYANIVGKMSVSNYQTDGWAAKAIDTVKKTGVSEAQYIALYLAKGGIESLKDKNGDTISNSEGLQIMELVYQQKGLSDKQRAALFEDFGVGKSIRHWNRARVDEQLAIMRKKAA